jgi:hypothetical protein
VGHKNRSGKQRRSGGGFDVADFEFVPESCNSVLSIDPGSGHNGIALFGVEDEKWAVLETHDFKPEQALLLIVEWLQIATGVLVVEGFQLYPNMLQELGLTRLGVVEVIGAIEWAYISSYSGDRVGMYVQGASIKAAGRRFMEQNGIAETGSNVHKRDAEAHGWYRVKKILEHEGRVLT